MSTHMMGNQKWDPNCGTQSGTPMGPKSWDPQLCEGRLRRNTENNWVPQFGSLLGPLLGPAIWVPIVGQRLGPRLGPPLIGSRKWVRNLGPNLGPCLGPLIGFRNWVRVPHAQAKLGQRPGRPTVIIQLSLVEIHWIPQGPSTPPPTPPPLPLAISQALEKYFFLTDRKVRRNH